MVWDRKDIPNEMTPTAWKKPVLMNRDDDVIFPLRSEGRLAPCVITVKRMMTMLSNANVEALDNCAGKSVLCRGGMRDPESFLPLQYRDTDSKASLSRAQKTE